MILQSSRPDNSPGNLNNLMRPLWAYGQRLALSRQAREREKGETAGRQHRQIGDRGAAEYQRRTTDPEGK
jgi:hypothetical protein